MASIFWAPLAPPAGAADKLWDNVNGGLWTLATNWFGGVPGTGDVARFETTNSNLFQRTYTVFVPIDPTNQQLIVEDDGVTLDLFGSPSNHTYTLSNSFVAMALGTVPNRSGNLTVNRGTLALPSQSDLEIAPVAGASGALTVGAGGLVSGNPDVLVGLNGNGALNVINGGDVTANRVTIGVDFNSTGTATIAGGGSTLIGATVTVGALGSGVLNITGGGAIESTFGVVGGQPGSSGTVNVQGAGSLWDVNALVVGEDASDPSAGVSTLNILDGGKVVSSAAININTTGRVNVAGEGSTWVISGDAIIGNSLFHSDRFGTLLIQPGGVVNVAGELALGAQGLVRLEGGTLRASSIDAIFEPFPRVTDQLDWTGGTLEIGTFMGPLTVPSDGVLAPIRSPIGASTTEAFRLHGKLAIEVGGPFQFTDYSTLQVNGVAILEGALEVKLTDGFVPAASNVFRIVEAVAGPSGAFTNVANGQRLFTADGLGSFIVNYGPASPFGPQDVVLSQFQLRAPGDFDHDGDVDGVDFLIWQRGQSPAPLSDTDFAAWKANFGAASTMASPAVPEAFSATLFAIGAVAAAPMRRCVARCPASRRRAVSQLNWRPLF